MTLDHFMRMILRIRELDNLHATWFLMDEFNRLHENKNNHKFPIHTQSGEYRMVPCKSLLYVKAEGNYTSLYYLYRGKVEHHTYSYNLGAVKSHFYEAGMRPIHKSYLINPVHIEELNASAHDENFVILTTGIQLPLSHSCAARCRRYFEEHDIWSKNPFLSL